MNIAEGTSDLAYAETRGQETVIYRETETLPPVFSLSVSFHEALHAVEYLTPEPEYHDISQYQEPPIIYEDTLASDTPERNDMDVAQSAPKAHDPSHEEVYEQIMTPEYTYREIPLIPFPED